MPDPDVDLAVLEVLLHAFPDAVEAEGRDGGALEAHAHRHHALGLAGRAELGVKRAVDIADEARCAGGGADVERVGDSRSVADVAELVEGVEVDEFGANVNVMVE